MRSDSFLTRQTPRDNALFAFSFAATIAECDPSLKGILTDVFTLYLCSLVERNATQLILDEVVTPQEVIILIFFISSGVFSKIVGFQSAQIRNTSAMLCAKLGPQAVNLIDSFGLTDRMLSAPIARDWVAYNEYDNQGEMKEE